MRREIVIVLISVFVISLVSGALVLLVTDETNLLEIKEVVWEGGIWNGHYYIQVVNPTGKIIEASVYVYVENISEKWNYIKCGNDFASKIPLLTTFYPNSTTLIHTYSKDYLYTDSVKVIALSGDQHLLDEMVNVDKWLEAEVLEVVWGEMVNSPYAPEDTIWLNFTVLYHGRYNTLPRSAVSMWTLEAYYGDSYMYIDERPWGYWPMQIGVNLNKKAFFGRTTISNYRLLLDDKRIWEGTVQEG